MSWVRDEAIWAGPGARWQQTTLQDTRIRWVEQGSGPPLVLLHGYGGSARWWARNLSALGRLRRVYALDLPGFGSSRLRAPFTLAGAADLIAGWMDERRIGRADVVAHSMGGQLAVVLAARHPDRVGCLVLAAPAGIPFGTGLVGIATRALRSRQGGDPRFTPLALRGALQAGPRVMWQALGEIRAVDVRAYLPAIEARTLVLWGERDTLLSPAGGPVLASAIVGATLRVVPGGRHNLMWEQADDFNAIVSAFLETCPCHRQDHAIAYGQPPGGLLWAPDA